MINNSDLQAFIEKIENGAVGVDLMKIGQHYAMQQLNAANNKQKFNNNSNFGKFRIALDMEQCMDRWYGGYYSDWACGGQWNRTLQFVQLLANAFNAAHIDVIAFFDGTLKENRKLTQERNEYRQRCISVLKHIRMIGTPPPKIWWLPPSGIKTCLRNALRSMNIQVVQTVNNHTMEIIDYFHEYKLNGILGVHPDFIIANISRYFSSHDLRLSYRGNLETKEYMVHKVLSTMKLTQDQLAILAAFLGGHILIDDVMLKQIYQKLNIEYNSDYEGRIRKLGDLIRGENTSNLDEFLKKLDLTEFAANLKTTIEYYQRKASVVAGKKNANKKKILHDSKTTTAAVPAVVVKEETPDPLATPVPPMASEISDIDELSKKMLKEVNNLVNEDNVADETAEETTKKEATPQPTTSKETGATAKQQNKPKAEKKTVKFVYTLPAEVVRTALQRHQRGIMDARIYVLLTKREILLPQVLEDENYREIPPVHLFYRPARQMIYAILFNMYHQKYMCTKSGEEVVAKNKEANKNKKQQQQQLQPGPPPDVKISEWIWSPQNEYSKPELVTAQCLNWAVPTVQRLWFGTNFEDKQRRMRAFLTVMRSDSQLMLNRSYVPQHMLVMACVLRYIVTSPERNILTRSELDAFMATAFSPHLLNVENTQEMVLPGVHLRGVYLATLFMQGVETAQLANDVCGVPLPWMMTNPWLFFDGKLFHLKLKMASCVQSLRELCDEQIESVIKIERFRKAVLEDVEHFLLPAHIDPLYRPGFFPTPTHAQQHGSQMQAAYKQNSSIHPLSNIPSLLGGGGGAGAYGANSQYPQFFNNIQNTNGLFANGNQGRNTLIQEQQARKARGARNGNNYHQLKVGGVVVCSWADGGVQNRGSLMGSSARLPRTGMFRLPIGRGRPATLRSPHNAGRLQLAPPGVPSISRTIGRNYQQKQRINRTRRNKTKKEKKTKTEVAKKLTATNGDVKTEDADEGGAEKIVVTKKESEELDQHNSNLLTSANECTVELQNGNTVLASDLANSMCDKILKDEIDELPTTTESTNQKESEVADENNENATPPVTNGTTSPNNSSVPSANTKSNNNKNKNKKAKKLAKNSASSDGGVDAETNGKGQGENTANAVKG